ncbi:MAG: NAD(P)-dependent oxidoreductase, partial [Candidatus Thorarchaeota archaeon]
MKILVTGAFGNIGESTLLALGKKNHEIRVFDIKSDATVKKCKTLSKQVQFETIWGDITNKESIELAMEGVDIVIHLAAIIPPGSEANPELSQKVNVGGTETVIEIANGMANKPRIIFASSVSTYGPRGPQEPPVTADLTQVPTDNYTHHKIKCEQLLKDSGLSWTVLRLAAIPTLELTTDIDTMLFDTPFNQRIEFGHTRDVGTAFANAVDLDLDKQVFLIGGGKGSQMLWGDFINGLFQVMGMRPMPEEAFIVPKKLEDWYYTDWMDTDESQAVLQYQEHTYQD